MFPGEGARWHNGTEMEAPARSAAAGGCFGPCPALSSGTRSPLGHRCVTARPEPVPPGHPSKRGHPLPSSCISAASLASAFLVFGGAILGARCKEAARRFSSPAAQGTQIGLQLPVPPGIPANPSSVSLARAGRCPKGVHVPYGGGSGCEKAKAGLGSSPQHGYPPSPHRGGSAELGDQHSQAATVLPATSVLKQDRAW